MYEDLSFKQVQVIKAFEKYGRCTYTEVSKLSGIPINSCSARIHELEKKGYIEKVSHNKKSGRVQSVYAICNPRKEPIKEQKTYPISRTDVQIIKDCINMSYDSFMEKHGKKFFYDEPMNAYVKGNKDYWLKYVAHEGCISLVYNKIGVFIGEIIDVVDYTNNGKVVIHSSNSSIDLRLR